MAGAGDGRCDCGHGREAHEHYRRGSDCATCGPEVCARFRPAGGPIKRFVRLLGQLRSAWSGRP